MLNNILDRIRLPFRKDKELYLSLYNVLGFYPHNISYYKLALMHKSVMHRNAKGKPVNNERLEFLGDAILDAIVGDIVYRHFPGKREGFLTNTRSKLVQRETLNKLAKEMGINELILSSGHSLSHNSYMGGNAFEALVGALYLDRGYDVCMKFMQKRILAKLINIDKVAYKEVNFKSKLIEWSQKNKVKINFDPLQQDKDKNGSPVFVFRVMLEGVEGCTGNGYSKKKVSSWPLNSHLKNCAVNRNSSTRCLQPRLTEPKWRRSQLRMCRVQRIKPTSLFRRIMIPMTLKNTLQPLKPRCTTKIRVPTTTAMKLLSNRMKITTMMSST